MSLKLPPMPPRIAKLPRDHRGYPVPYFVAWVDGKPDHRIADPHRMARARELGLCNLCGEKLGKYKAFVIGPMCSVNRISSEPPSHRECAEFAVRACPFLSIPGKGRRSHNLPEDVQEGAGAPLYRNPGVVLIWITTTFTHFRTGDKDRGEGVLYEMGAAATTLWYCEGRPATRAEAMKSLTTGLPFLMAAAQSEGEAAVTELRLALEAATLLLPPDDGSVQFPGLIVKTVSPESVEVDIGKMN